MLVVVCLCVLCVCVFALVVVGFGFWCWRWCLRVRGVLLGVALASFVLVLVADVAVVSG